VIGDAVSLVEVPLTSVSLDRFQGVLDAEQVQTIHADVARAQAVFAGRVMWNVNSTARGGGVAEMLYSLLPYVRGSGVDARWLVIDGDPEFFSITKRIHNQLQGSSGDGGGLGDAERAHYQKVLAANARQLVERIGSHDVVILHDPQTAGLVPALHETGARVLWRCHVGVDLPNQVAHRAWSFLRPYVLPADACIFSREPVAGHGLDHDRVWVVAPSIDAFSAKNRDLDEATVSAVLNDAGIVYDSSGGEGRYPRCDGGTARVEHHATVVGDPLPASARLVVQISRWDRLKDPVGVIHGFAEYVAPRHDVHLVIAGPAVEAVSDDPEGAKVLAESSYVWRSLRPPARRRTHLVCLPMEDAEENAIMVNALQRRATVAVQKSLAEGFGLTVAESMWKGRPVVASRIGGIQDQIEDSVSGLLVDDPTDLAAYGRAVCRLLDDPGHAAALGEAARRRVTERFLGPGHLKRYLDLIGGTGS